MLPHKSFSQSLSLLQFKHSSGKVRSKHTQRAIADVASPVYLCSVYYKAMLYRFGFFDVTLMLDLEPWDYFNFPLAVTPGIRHSQLEFLCDVALFTVSAFLFLTDVRSTYFGIYLSIAECRGYSQGHHPSPKYSRFPSAYVPCSFFVDTRREKPVFIVLKEQARQHLRSSHKIHSNMKQHFNKSHSA